MKDDFKKGYQKAMQYYPRDIGYWKQAANGGFYCSECGVPVVNVKRIPDFLFCPHCGANMQGQENKIKEAVRILANATAEAAKILEGV